MLFLDSFEMFINATAVPYIRCGETAYAFPEHKLIVHLVALGRFIGDNQSNRNEIVLDGEALSIDPAAYEHLFLYEDRWFSGGMVIRKRLLAMLGQFKSLFARKCKILAAEEFIDLFANATLPEKLITKIGEFYDYNALLSKIKRGKASSKAVMPKSLRATALNVYIRLISDFLDCNHSYGASKCSFRYMLLYREEIVAVATFSSPKIINRIVSDNSSKEISLSVRSYEWVRYASLPDIRVIGGMGKLLKSFLRDIEAVNLPVEVMSYSDNEWSSGRVYEQLGFTLAGKRKPVDYYVDTKTYKRYNLRQFGLMMATSGGNVTQSGEFCKICNRGSRKFLLMLSN